ncbi:MAG: F0F1 ATP synthase subunit A [Mariprofundaceae bacterium]
MTHEPFQPLASFEPRPLIGIRLGGLDLSLDSAGLAMLFAALLSFALLFAATRRATPERPGRAWMMVELYHGFVRRMTLDNIREGERFVPLIFTLFTFIAVCNLLGQIPGVFTATSQIVVTGTLAAMVFGYSVLLRFRRHGWRALLSFAPAGAPRWLLPLMIPIELLSFLARPVSLAVRLFANMTAGHTVLGVLAFFGLLAPWFAQWLPMALSVALQGVELFIAVIQAYIFSVLSCVYIDDAL